MEALSLQNIIFTVAGYHLSLIELIGTVTGLICVWLAAKQNILTWPIGIINLIAFTIIFYQVQLYSDMLLQSIFLWFSIIGWIQWKHGKLNNLKVTAYTRDEMVTMSILTMLLIACLSYLMMNIHLIMPELFPQPAAFPKADATTTVLSTVAIILMGKKKLEAWALWIIVDVMCIIVYAMKGIMFMSIEYAIFLIIAIFGFIKWSKEYNNEDRISNR